MKRVVPLALLCALACASLDPGPHRVGYRDGTWYPATDGGEMLRLRDYVPRLEEWDMRLHARGFSDEEIVELFDTEMRARAHARGIAAAFPRLRIALQEGEVAGDYAMLAELLAGHGYIVTVNDDPAARVIRVDGFSTLDFHRNPAAARRGATRLLRKLRSIDKPPPIGDHRRPSSLLWCSSVGRAADC